MNIKEEEQNSLLSVDIESGKLLLKLRTKNNTLTW